jgi:plastocyanin
MKKLLLTAALVTLASPAFAKEYTIKEMSDPAGDKPYYFAPDTLHIQPGDTVTFLNAQEDTHDVMFVEVPKGVDEMIMSPMHEKEGDRFSYTFSVPGTYKFHCHPHESLGMKGTLIVGQASGSGETVMMDHHKMTRNMEGHGHKADTRNADTRNTEAAPAAEAKGIAATGIVNSVDITGGSINVTHNPIKALGWPKMKMEFNVEKGVDLSSVKAGDSVSFTLKDRGNDDYSLSSIKKSQ